jgi:hypothetical protein
MKEQILKRAAEYRESSRKARSEGLQAVSDNLDGKASGLLIAAQMLPDNYIMEGLDYLAWARWAGDTQHRHLALCDSDADGAFKIYRL